MILYSSIKMIIIVIQFLTLFNLWESMIMRELKVKASRLFAGFMAAAMMLGSGIVSPDNELKTVHAGKYGLTPVKITENTFPDPNFRAYVKEAFDTDKNGTLDEDEILVARNIWADERDIYSLDGIEYLTELRGLYASHNHLTKLDLSKNQQITGVWVAYNDFTSLDFSSTPSLEWVYCFYCPYLTNLDVTGNPKMSYIECNSSPVGNLDLSKNPVLEHLMCCDCGMTELDLSHNPNMQHLDCMLNDLTELDVTVCPKMKRLDTYGNQKLGAVDVSKCPGLQSFSCAQTGATKVDVSKNPQLTKLVVSYNNNLKKIDISHNPKLEVLQCQNTAIKELDLSNNHYVRFLWAFYNSLTKLNIGDCPFLVKTLNEGVHTVDPDYGKYDEYIINYGGQDSTQGDSIYTLVVNKDVKLNTKSTGKGPDLNATSRKDEDLDLPPIDQRISREMAIQTLYELAGKPSVKGLKTRFKDVEKGAWYEDVVIWGENNAICTGYPYVVSDTFGVGKCIERQDVLLMLMRYTEYKKYKREIDFGRSDDFIDYYEVDAYAWEAVCWAATWRILEGKGEEGAPKEKRKIDPHGKCTRNEFIEFIQAMYQINDLSVPKASKIPVPDKSYAPQMEGRKSPKTTQATTKTDTQDKNGVGTVSKDGKTLTDPSGEKYKVAEKVTKDNLKANVKIADKKSGGKYKITKVTKKNGKIIGGNVTYMKPYNKNCKSANVAGSVKLGGVTFKVTAVASNAFKNCKALTKVTVGKNVAKIGANAFAGDKKLTKINIVTTKLKSKNVGKNILKGTTKKLIISVPKKKKSTYSKIFKSRGNKSVTVK